MSTLNEKDLSQKIQDSLNRELEFLDHQETNVNAILNRLDPKEKKARRSMHALPVTVLSLLLLITSVALAAGHWTGIAEWLGIKNRVETKQPSVILAKDDFVSLELVEAATFERNIVLAVHAVPQQDSVLLCPYPGVSADSPLMGKVFENIDEEHGNLTVDEYAKLTGKSIRWLLFYGRPKGENELSYRVSATDDWVLQEDGSVMIFYNMDLGEYDKAALRELETTFASMTTREKEDYVPSVDNSLTKRNAVHLDWAQISPVEPKYTALDSLIQEDSGVELRDIRLYSTPHCYILKYMYRVQKDSVASLHPRVLVAPAKNIIWVNGWDTQEVEVDGETWIQCYKTFYSNEDDLPDWFVSVQYQGEYVKSEFRLE